MDDEVNDDGVRDAEVCDAEVRDEAWWARELHILVRHVLADVHGLRGRPSLDRQQGPCPQIAARVPRWVHERALLVAARRRVPVSWVVREALEHYLDPVPGRRLR